MIENVDDDPVETKPSFVDYSVEIKPPKVETFVKVEALHVNFGVSELGVNEVDTNQFFSSQNTWKDKDKLLGWIRQQANRTGWIYSCHKKNLCNKESNVGDGL